MQNVNRMATLQYMYSCEWSNHWSISLANNRKSNNSKCFFMCSASVSLNAIITKYSFYYTMLLSDEDNIIASKLFFFFFLNEPNSIVRRRKSFQRQKYATVTALKCDEANSKHHTIAKRPNLCNKVWRNW